MKAFHVYLVLAALAIANLAAVALAGDCCCGRNCGGGCCVAKAEVEKAEVKTTPVPCHQPLHGCKVQCPCCKEYCQLQVDKDKAKLHCYEVECKHICIPAVKFPWEKCCGPTRCARAKTVKVLKKVEYECPICKYTWTPVPCDECGCCRTTCGEAHAIEGGAEEGEPPMPPAAPKANRRSSEKYY